MIHKKWLVLTIFILALLLTACSQEVHLYFYPEEAWKVQTTIEVTSGILGSLGDWFSDVADDQLSQLPIPDELGDAVGDIAASGTSAGMDQVVAYYAARSIQVDWEKRPVQDGSVYKLTFKGSGEQSFESLLPQGILDLIQIGEDRYQLDVEIGDFNPYVGLVFKQNIHLHARDIVNANAARLSGGIATWHNPARMTATFSPISPILGKILLIFGGLGVLMALFVLVRKAGKKRCWNCSAKIPRNAEFCPECGVDILS